jgi:hypothetical protein
MHQPREHPDLLVCDFVRLIGQKLKNECPLVLRQRSDTLCERLGRLGS